MMTYVGVLAHYHNTLMQPGQELGLGHSGALPGVPIQSHNTLMQPGQALGGGNSGTLPDVILEENLITVRRLGSGSFGTVDEGLLNGETLVAIKTRNPVTMQLEAFLEEANVMRSLHHKNLVKVYGVVFKEPTRIVMEYMRKGDLLQYLLGEGQSSTLCDRIQNGIEVASGMAFIHSMGYVHRDLHPGNVLVDENNVCKIADFGLARFAIGGIYNAGISSRFPAPWTAPEAASWGHYTFESDVWSFGVLMLTILKKGMTVPNLDVHNQLLWINGMLIPECCINDLCQMMAQCCDISPNARPNFTYLKSLLERMRFELLQNYTLSVTASGSPYPHLF